MGEHREEAVCGFLSRQLGEQEQPNSTEIDEIEAGVQVELKRGGPRAGQG